MSAVRPFALWALCAMFAACADPIRDVWPDGPRTPIDLKVTLTPTSVALLEPVTVTFDVFAAGATPPELSFEPPPDLGRARRTTTDVARDDGVWRRVTVVLHPRKVGDHALPPARASIGEHETTITPPALTVVGALPESGDAATLDAEAPAPPFAAEAETRPWWILVVAAAVVVALWLWARRRRRAPAAAEAIALPPHVAALRALARLRHSPRRTAVEIEAFYVEVSRILREYLEARFSLHAPERTTDEFLAEAERDPRLTATQRATLSQFLAQCDLVKFARVLPDADAHAATFAVAEEFVETTREDRMPRAEAS